MVFKDKSQSRVVSIFSILILLWFGFGFFVVPYLIEQAYHQQSHPILNQIISGAHIHGLDLYLNKWQGYFAIGLLFLITYPAILIGIRQKRFWRSFIGVATPQYLALMRIFACFALLLIVIFEDFASFAYLPQSMRFPMGIMKIFYALPIGFDKFVANHFALRIFHILTGIFLFLGMIGYKHRIFIPLGVFFYLILGGIIRQYCHLIHPGLVPLYVLCVLSFAPCSDVWSLDAALKKRDTAFKGSLYAFYRYACWIVIALPYVFSGLSKLRNSGFSWWQGLNLKAIMLRDSVNIKQVHFDGGLLMKDLPDIFFSGLGLFTVIGEIFFILILFFSWARVIFPLAMILMHIGILWTQNVMFLDLIVFLWVFLAGEMIEKRAKTDALLKEVKPSTKGALILSSIAVILIFSWILRIEYYPLTSWQMYSDIKDKEITYYKIMAQHDSGQNREFYPSRIIAAMRYGRVNDRIGYCFQPDQFSVCYDFYLQCGRLYNNREENEDKIKAFEIQKWRWDVVSDIENPNYGYVQEQKIISVR